jgi:flagellar hook assembly protein FlgD
VRQGEAADTIHKSVNSRSKRKLGKLVKTLVDETVGEGYREYTWDGRDARGSRVGSGGCFYTLTTGDRTLTRKMTAVK